MKYHDHLIMRARSYWGNDQELPADLFAEMLNEGIDVSEAERNYHDSNSY